MCGPKLASFSAPKLKGVATSIPTFKGSIGWFLWTVFKKDKKESNNNKTIQSKYTEMVKS